MLSVRNFRWRNDVDVRTTKIKKSFHYLCFEILPCHGNMCEYEVIFW